MNAWADAAWIGRPPGEVIEVDPTPASEDRPDLTMALRPPALLRAEFDARRGSARLVITALGLYTAHLNGVRVGDHRLAPGWTDYHQRVHAQEFDVTELLREGRNVLTLVVADGWYAGYVGFDRGHQARLYGDTPRVMARIADANDTTLVATGPQWRRSTGRHVYADLQMGEMQSGLRERAGWRELGFDDTGWPLAHVTERSADDPVILASAAPPMRVIEERGPESILDRGDGRQIVDFGQNLVGVVRVRLRDNAPGTRVHLRHVEVLDDDGEPYVANLRTALAHDIYECAGGLEVFEPDFTFHGFRYVEVHGHDAPLQASDITALVIHTDAPRVGWLETGDAAVTRLHENIDWTVRGNLLDVPTDCPQRDERLGWLGDAGLIMTTASWMRDLGGLLRKWTADIRDAQKPDGAYPDVAPLANLTVAGAPGWADAGAIVPWIGYVHTGDRALLSENYDAMRRFVDHLVRSNPDLVRSRALGRNYGDWLNLDDPTPKPLLATAYFAYTAEALAHTAAVLGHDAHAQEYRQLRAAVTTAFRSAFVNGDRLEAGSQTAYALALHLDLLAADTRAGAAGHLVEAIRERGHLTTGIHGTRFLLPALSDTGHDDVAYELALRRTHPSWLSALDAGATTIWERWDGWVSGRGFQTPRMNSFNHYALGSVGEWLHRYALGLTPLGAAPEFERVVVRPHPSARLGTLWGRRMTSRGPIECSWRLEGDDFQLELTLPAGATASVWLPTSSPHAGWEQVEAGAGSHHYRTRVAADWRAPNTLSPDRLDNDSLEAS